MINEYWEEKVAIPLYYRLCETTEDKGELIPVTEDVYKHINNLEKDHYVSIFQYTQEHYNKFYEQVWDEKKNKYDKRGCSGITDVLTNKLVFDFDYETDLEVARQSSIELVNRLLSYKLTEENIKIMFSGYKGFTIEVDTDETLTPRDAKMLAVGVAGNLKGFDSVIYNANRIFRVPLTKHQVSGLYKIPLTYDQLVKSSISDIKGEAVSTDGIDPNTLKNYWKPAKLPKSLLSFKTPQTKKEAKTMTPVLTLDFTKKPRFLDNARWALQNGFFEEGERSTALLCLASTYKNLGFEQDHVYRLLKGVAELQAKRTDTIRFPDEELYNNVCMQVFGPNWKGGQYSTRDPGSWLYNYCIKMNLDVNEKQEKIVLEPSDLIESFCGYVKNFDKNRILTGIQSIDDNVYLTIGMPVGILGAPSIGKTSLLLNILHYNSKNNVHSMFFSLDMFNAHVTQKFMQKFTLYDFERLKNMIINDPVESVKHFETIKKEIECVHTVCKSGTTVDEMKSIILDYQRETGHVIKLVAIDYLELISGPYSDETANGGYNARKLKELSTDLGVCVLVLLQPQKTVEPDEPIKSYRSIKGASLLEQCFRVVLSAYRPGFGADYVEADKFIGINCVKNSLGKLFSTHLYFDGFSGIIREMTDEEHTELKELQNRKESDKDDKGGESW